MLISDAPWTMTNFPDAPHASQPRNRNRKWRHHRRNSKRDNSGRTWGSTSIERDGVRVWQVPSGHFSSRRARGRSDGIQRHSDRHHSQHLASPIQREHQGGGRRLRQDLHRGSDYTLPVPSLQVSRGALAWQWSPSLTGLWWLSHQYTLWGLEDCCFPEWEAWSLTLGILDSDFTCFLAGVSHRDAGIGLGTFPTPWFAWALSAGIYLQYWVLCLTHPRLARPILHPFVFFAASWSGL